MLRILIATLTFTCLDALWLGWLGTRFYREEMGHLMRLSNTQAIIPNWSAAIVVYLVLIAGLLLFAIPKANGSLTMAFVWGALFGLVAYGTYDFTNLAVLADWSLKISLIDTLWGMIICGTTAWVTVFFTAGR
jgi:uncharacterized membrane protein